MKAPTVHQVVWPSPPDWRRVRLIPQRQSVFTMAYAPRRLAGIWQTLHMSNKTDAQLDTIADAFISALHPEDALIDRASVLIVPRWRPVSGSTTLGSSVVPGIVILTD